MKKFLCVFAVALLVALVGVFSYAQDKGTPQTQSSGQLASASITVKGITCNGCVNRVQDALKALDGVKDVKMTKQDFKKKTGVVDVSYASAKVSVKDMENAIADLGFDAGPAEAAKSCERMEKREGKDCCCCCCCCTEKACGRSEGSCSGKEEESNNTHKHCGKEHKGHKS